METFEKFAFSTTQHVNYIKCIIQLYTIATANSKNCEFKLFCKCNWILH